MEKNVEQMRTDISREDVVELKREKGGFDVVIEKGLIEVADECVQRAKEYYQMAREYSRFSPSAVTDVLIVEDNESNSRLIQSMLEKEGFKCVVASTAEEALLFCNTEIPLVVLMDIELPDSDGLVLTRSLRMREEMKFVPIIAVTAHVNNDTMMKAMEAGCDNFIGKPFTREYFVRIVQQALEKIGRP